MNDRERDPYKVMMIAAMFVIGVITSLAYNRVATSTLMSFPAPWGRVFLAAIVANSGMSLYGIALQHTVRGVLWERAGQWGLSVLFLIYGVWGFGLFREKATGFSTLLLALAAAAILRIVQIDRRRRAVDRGPS
jgi:hypothetical protein